VLHIASRKGNVDLARQLLLKNALALGPHAVDTVRGVLLASELGFDASNAPVMVVEATNTACDRTPRLLPRPHRASYRVMAKAGRDSAGEKVGKLLVPRSTI
jgi:hypothetical protein